MKKKIINGILLVAMLFAATTSFVSCKDNVDDQLVGVYDQLTKDKNELSGRIATLEGQIGTLQSELNNTKADVTTIKGQIAELQSDVNDLKGRLAAVESQIATLSADVDTLKNDMAIIDARLTAVEDVVGKLIEVLGKGLITEIAVNHTVNDLIGSINVPGVNVKMLAALFGDNQTYIEKFPVTGSDYNVDTDKGTYLDATDIAGAKFIELNEDYITKPNGNGGKFFFTANSLDKSTFNINDWTLSLEASDGTIAPIHFDNVKPSNYVVQWGLYKSQVLGSNEAAEDLGFYEADATIEPEFLEQCKFNARNHVDFKALKDEIKQAVENVKAAKGSKAELKAMAKEAAKLVENIFSGNMSGDNRFIDDPANPTYAAQRLVMTQSLDSAAIRFQDADLDVALTAVSPLSYNSFWNLEKNPKKLSSDIVDKIAARLAKIWKKLHPDTSTSGTSLSSVSIEIPELVGNTIVFTSAAGKEEIIIDETLQNEINEAIAEGMTDIDLTEAIQNLDGGSLSSSKDNVTKRFESWINKASNAYIRAMKRHALTRAVSPIILYTTQTGVHRMATGTTVKAGVMQINMTSATEELIVPPYEKYIAVKDGSGKITESATVPGNTQLWTLNLTTPGEYTVILSCVDYYGYVVTKKYYITVE